MSRRAVWLQLVLGWLPLWALFTVLIYFVHSGVSAHAALFISLRSIIGAVILGFAVQRFTEKFPWPSAVHIQFVLLHIGAALAYAFGWGHATIWFGKPFSVGMKDAFDGIVMGLITAGLFGWLWPR